MRSASSFDLIIARDSGIDNGQVYETGWTRPSSPEQEKTPETSEETGEACRSTHWIEFGFSIPRLANWLTFVPDREGETRHGYPTGQKMVLDDAVALERRSTADKRGMQAFC